MDPDVTWRRLRDAFQTNGSGVTIAEDADRNDVLDLLNALGLWMAQGGFKPTDFDTALYEQMLDAALRKWGV